MNEHDRLRILLDIGPLGYSQDNRSGARGIHRVAQNLFEGLVASNRYDLQFLATSHLAGAYEFLEANHLVAEKCLKAPAGQLQLSRMGREASRWVHGRMAERGFSARAGRWLAARFAAVACAGEKRVPSRLLEGVDIYHSPLAPIPRSVRLNTKARHFLTVHDLLAFSLPQMFMKGGLTYIKRLLGSLSPESFVFCVSESVKQDLLHYAKLGHERIFVTPLAADRRIFSPVTESDKIAEVRKKYGIPDAPYFLTLSSFDPRKNFGHIIRCFSQLIESGQLKDCCLVLVGSNPERNSFVEEAIARHPQIGQRIIMPGFIQDQDLAAIYSGALSFLFPSLGEGFGMPVLEAMQCGTPVISSNTTSLPEVIGDAGLLLNPNDEDAWCQAIIDFSKDSDKRALLRKKGILRADCFTWQRFMNETERGYAFACA